MDRGFVFWAKADGSEIREVISFMLTPNGIGLSPDGSTLYVAETETARLWAFEVKAPGEVVKLPWPSPSGGRLVAGLGGYRRFDSLAVLASGNICVAAVDSCAVVEISPSGQILQEYPVPDLLVTNICFGGDDLRDAFVTMSYSGKLAKLKWSQPGLRLHFQNEAHKVMNTRSAS
jgi:gluconolactonase